MAVYDFETLVDRRGTGSFKWEEMLGKIADAGEGIVPLSVADMELPSPPEVVEALRDYLSDGVVLGYTGPTKSYFDACVSWQERRHAWHPEAEWIVTSPGVVPAFYNCVRAYTKPGEGVIIQDPVYYPFTSAIESNGRRVVGNTLICQDGVYTMDFDDLEAKAADPANTMLILCSPHNPVGRVWGRDELRRVVDICLANDVLIVSDEIHDDLIMPGYEHTTIMNVMETSEYDHVVVCTAPSKTFNLAGIQCSNIYIPDPELRKRFQQGFERIAQNMLNSFSYVACEAAYTRCEGWLDQLIGLVYENWTVARDTLCGEFDAVRVSPLEGTYLLWADFSAWGMDPKEQERFMLEEAKLCLDEGYIFGKAGEGFERINLACPTKVVRDAVGRLVDARKRQLR